MSNNLSFVVAPPPEKDGYELKLFHRDDFWLPEAQNKDIRNVIIFNIDYPLYVSYYSDYAKKLRGEEIITPFDDHIKQLQHCYKMLKFPNADLDFANPEWPTYYAMVYYVPDYTPGTFRTRFGYIARQCSLDYKGHAITPHPDDTELERIKKYQEDEKMSRIDRFIDRNPFPENSPFVSFYSDFARKLRGEDLALTVDQQLQKNFEEFNKKMPKGFVQPKGGPFVLPPAHLTEGILFIYHPGDYAYQEVCDLGNNGAERVAKVYKFKDIGIDSRSYYEFTGAAKFQSEPEESKTLDIKVLDEVLTSESSNNPMSPMSIIRNVDDDAENIRNSPKSESIRTDTIFDPKEDEMAAPMHSTPEEELDEASPAVITDMINTIVQGMIDSRPKGE